MGLFLQRRCKCCYVEMLIYSCYYNVITLLFFHWYFDALCLTVDFSCDNTVRIHVTCLHEGGFYSLVIKPGLRLVSLNTNLYYSPNEVTVNMSDPAGQFQWLQETLELSRQNMEKVSLFCLLSTRHFNFRKSLLH